MTPRMEIRTDPVQLHGERNQARVSMCLPVTLSVRPSSSFRQAMSCVPRRHQSMLGGYQWLLLPSPTE